MLGAIIGDIVGSRFEFHNYRGKNFTLFTKYNYYTDDSVCTCAIADALYEFSLLKNGSDKQLFDLTVDKLQKFGRIFTGRGFGGSFYRWIYSSNPKPYNSWGNGAAMRVSPVAYFAKNEQEVKKYARIVTEVTHNHPEGLIGAEVTAMCIYKCLNGASKDEIKRYAKQFYPIITSLNYEKLKETYEFNETCRDTVPQAIFCFLISKNFEDCIRTCVSIGGDTDTLCAIACSIAEAYYYRKEVRQDSFDEYPLKQYFSRREDKMLIKPIEKIYNLFYKNNNV